MKKTLLIFIITIFSLSVTFSQTQIMDLSCEYKKDPLGLNIKAPRLSWKIFSGEAGQVQTAYQVLVASSPNLLTSSKADLWNSQKRESSQSVHVDYAGKELGSRQKCWWVVRVWDKNGKASKWSEPAYFEMGLLSPDDWKAQWIKTSIIFDEYSYPSPMLRKEFVLDKKILRARAYVTSLGL